MDSRRINREEIFRSETTKLKLFKHDNPSTNTNKFDVEKALNKNMDKIDNYAIENDDKVKKIEDKIKDLHNYDDTAITKKITNLENKDEEIDVEQETQNAQILALQKEKEALQDIVDSVLPYEPNEGESLTLKNTTGSRFRKIEVKGNDYQKKTIQGKNLMDLSKIDQGEKNGVTCTYDDENQTITLNGTCTKDNTNFKIPNDGLIPTKGKTTLSAYYVSGTCETVSSSSIRAWNANYSAGINAKLIGLSQEKPISKTTYSSDITSSLIKWSVFVNEGTVFDNYTIKAMLTEDVDTVYEPFIPDSPSVDYPSEIKAVGDNGNIAKINETDWELTENNTIRNKARNDGKVLTEDISLKKGQTITFNCNIISNTTNATSFALYANETNVSSKTIAINNRKGLTTVKYTATEDCTVYYKMWGNADSETFEFQFWANMGETATNYSPYNMGSANIIISNKNLWDFSKATGGTNNGITATINKDEGTYTLNGTVGNSATNIWLFGYYNSSKPLFVLPAGTYYIKDCLLYDKDHKYHGSLITITKDFEVVAIKIPNLTTGNQYINRVMYPMIIKTDVRDDDFEKHEEQNILVPVQQPMLEGDYFDLDKEKEVHNWKKVELTKDIIEAGSFTSTKLEGRGNRAKFSKIFDDYKYIDDNTINYKSNCFEAVKVVDRYLNSNEFFINTEKKMTFVIDKNSESAKEDVLNELKKLAEAGTPCTVYYQLETPTEIDLTEEQKTALEELRNAKTYKDLTHVYSIDEVSPIFRTEHYLPLGQINEVSSKSNVEEPSAEEKMDMPSIEENFTKDSEDTVEEVE